LKENAMSFHKPTRRELAFHEAGHAYVYAAITQRGEPQELGLGEDATGAHGWCRRNTLLYTEITLERVGEDVLPWIRWQAAAEIAIAMAGSVAEFRRRHGQFNGLLIIVQNLELFLKPGAFDVDGDFERVRRSMDYISPPDPLATLRRLVGVTDEIVDRNWRAILLLGRRLLERGVMGEDELIDWFDGRPAKPWKEPLTMD